MNLKLEDSLSLEETKERAEKLIEKTKGTTKLSILIASTKDRRAMLNILTNEFYGQIEKHGYAGKGKECWAVRIPMIKEGTENEQELDKDGNPRWYLSEFTFRHPPIVEVIVNEDNREMILGDKRNALLEKAKGEYIVFFDSDDFPEPNYVKEIMGAIKQSPDCVGFKIAMTTNGKQPEVCIHSLRNKEWTHNGSEYLRNVTHFNPVRKDLAIQAGFPSIRFGEDKVYSDKVSALCKNEVFIDKFLFNYRYSNQMPHNEKYGLIHDVK